MPLSAAARRALPLLLCSGLTPSCTDTLDLFGGETEGSGIDSQSDSETAGSSSSTTDISTSTSTSTSSSSSTSTSDGSSSTDTGTPVLDCSRLDLLLVVDTTADNAAVRAALPTYASALEVILRDPNRPWSDDFQVGFVPTQSVGDVAGCQVTGALSRQPDPLGLTCTTVTGDPWATPAEPNLTATLACLSALPAADVAPQTRPIALAAARGLGVPPAADPDGAAVVAGCTQGFARPDSYKVAMLVSGQDDDGSPGSPATWSSWFSPLHDAAAGSEFAIAGLVPLVTGDQCAAVPSNLEVWFGGEPNVVTIDWCEVQMGNLSVLTQLVDQIASLCE